MNESTKALLPVTARSLCLIEAIVLLLDPQVKPNHQPTLAITAWFSAPIDQIMIMRCPSLISHKSAPID